MFSLPEIIENFFFKETFCTHTHTQSLDVKLLSSLKNAFLYTGVFSMCTAYNCAYYGIHTYMCVPHIMWLLPKTTTFKNLYNIMIYKKKFV